VEESIKKKRKSANEEINESSGKGTILILLLSDFKAKVLLLLRSLS